MTMLQVLAASVLVSGLLALRAACRLAPGARRIGRALGGWLLLVVGFALWSFKGGADLNLSLAALALSLLAYVVVAGSVKIRARRARAAKERHVADDPLVRPSRPWRIGARLLLAGPLSSAFGVMVCLALAARIPIAEVDGVMLGGLLAPLAIAGAMIWSLTDERLARVTAGLGAAVLLTGLAAWPI